MSQTADILYQAAIEDLTGRFFDAFDKRIKQMDRQSKAASTGMQHDNQALGKSIGLVAGLVSGLTGQLVSMGLQGVAQLKALVQSSIGLAARADTLAVSVAQVGRNAGYTTDELAAYEEAIKSQGITTLNTRQIMVQLMGAQIDLAKASELARAAQNLAVIAGTDSSQMFQRLTHAVLTLNPAILTDIGLNVNLQAAYKATADQLGINADALDYTAKKQIAVDEVLRRSQPMMGTYESAMGTAGKQAGSMARHMEELQLAIGRAFQPAYSAWIQFQTRVLKEAREWFENNKESVEAFGQALGGLVTFLLNATHGLVKLVGALSPVLRLLTGLPGAVKEAGTGLAGLAVGQEEAQKRSENLGTTWKQTIAIMVGGATFGVTAIKEMVGAIMELLKAVQSLGPVWKWQGDEIDQISIALDRMEKRFAGVGQTASDAADQAFLDWSKAHGMLEEVAQEAETVADNMEQIAAETEDAIAKIREMNVTFTSELADIAKKRMRQDIDTEIQLARQREDMQRRALERLTDIYEDAAKRRADILADTAQAEREAVEDAHQQREDRERSYRQTLIDIEINYRRELQDIQSGYEYELTELVRRNDAVSILRLQRQTNERIRQAKTGRDREKEDAGPGYARDMEELNVHLARRRAELKQDAQQRLQDFEESLQEQLATYQENLDKEQTELERSLERRQEDLERHREWEDNDRQEAHQAELEELGAHFAGLETITESGLNYLLEQNGGAIENLADMWAGYYNWQRDASAGQFAGQNTPEWGGYSQEDEDAYNQGYQSGGFGVAQRPTTIKVGERGPEAFAAIPLGTSNVRHSFSDVNVNLHGVTPQTEAQLQPVLMEAFLGIVNAVKSQVGAGA